MDFSPLLSPASGPMWGAVGVVATALANWFISRRKTGADSTSAHLNAVNEANKTLAAGLFQQVKLLQEDVERQRGHTVECERQHRETMSALKEALKRIDALEARLAAPAGPARAIDLDEGLS